MQAKRSLRHSFKQCNWQFYPLFLTFMVYKQIDSSLQFYNSVKSVPTVFAMDGMKTFERLTPKRLFFSSSLFLHLLTRIYLPIVL